MRFVLQMMRITIPLRIIASMPMESLMAMDQGQLHHSSLVVRTITMWPITRLAAMMQMVYTCPVLQVGL